MLNCKENLKLLKEKEKKKRKKPNDVNYDKEKERTGRKGAESSRKEEERMSTK